MSFPTSIRAKVSLASTVISAIAMLAIVVVTAFITQFVLTSSISKTLESHLDVLQAELEAGVTDLSIEGTGAELIQVIDSDGNIIASSHWAEGISPITEGGLAPGEANTSQHQQFQLTREPDPPVNQVDVQVAEPSGLPDGESDPASTSSSQENQSAPSGRHSNSTNVYDATHEEDDDDDDDGEDEDEDDEDEDEEEDDDDGKRSRLELKDRSEDGDGDYRSERLAVESSESDDIDAFNPPEIATVSESALSPVRLFSAEKAYAAEPSEAQTPIVESFEQESISISGSQPVNAASIIGDDGPFLIIERGVSTPYGPVTIAAMASIAPALRAAQVIALILGGIMLLAIACVAALSWFMASRTLRPVIDMRSQVDDINASDLGKRIPVPKGDADLSKLAATFNGMLGRVEAAMTDQRRFISDASHELKSPVSATRLMLETAREHPETINMEALFKDLAYENERMGGIVENLLLLAQHDESRPHIEKHPIDLCDVLFEEAEALKARSNVNVDVSGIQPIICEADSTALRQAIRNMLDNAARYTKSTVKLSCSEQEGKVLIMVSDDGPGIPAADWERVFGRFVRLEEGRCRKKGSTGLGLAVVKTIAEQHGGTARFVEPELGGATIVFEIEA